MEDFRLRPASTYLHLASIEELYPLTEKWDSDMDFYLFELNFLKKLINKHFVMFTTKEDYKTIIGFSNEIDSLLETCTDIKLKIKEHLRRIHALMENPFSHDENEFRDEHVILEDRIASLFKGEVKLKQTIFNDLEIIMDHEKLLGDIE